MNAEGIRSYSRPRETSKAEFAVFTDLEGRVRLATDGFERMDAGREHGWRPTPQWGRDGWDLGNWPYVVLYRRDPAHEHDPRPGDTWCRWCNSELGEPSHTWEIACDVEGDHDRWAFPTKALRDEAMDYLFAWYAVSMSQEWAKGWDPEDASTIPEPFHGPFSWRRLTDAHAPAEVASRRLYRTTVHLLVAVEDDGGPGEIVDTVSGVLTDAGVYVRNGESLGIVDWGYATHPADGSAFFAPSLADLGIEPVESNQVVDQDGLVIEGAFLVGWPS